VKSCRRRILSLVLVILFVMTSTQSVSVLATEGRTAKIYEYSNDVTVNREKVDIKVFKGMRLKEGDTIKTGKSSNAYIEIDSDKVIKLDSSTIVTISNMNGTAENGSVNISLSSGKIYNDIKKKLTKNSTYKVRTPNAVMGVRGTTFVVDLKYLEDKSSETVLTVFDGTVAFAPSEQADSNVYVEMNQTANTTDLTEGEKPVVTEMNSKDLSSFELSEIIKDTQLQQNINKLLKKENKTLEEVLKQADKQEKELDKQDKELNKQEKELDKQEKEQDKQEKEQDKQEKELDKQEKELDKQEKELNKQEKELNKQEKEQDKQDKELDKQEKELDKQEKEPDKQDKELDRKEKEQDKQDKQENQKQGERGESSNSDNSAIGGDNGNKNGNGNNGSNGSSSGSNNGSNGSNHENGSKNSNNR